MCNEVIWVILILLSFSSILLMYKFMGKVGLIIWIVLATIISNIQTIKLIDLFGLETSLGTVLYGTVFLATDIMNFKYGAKEAKKTIVYGFVAMILSTFFLYTCLLYQPSVNDFANESLKLIFTFNLRVTLASLIGFAVSQFIDAHVFNFLQKKYNKLWISNNVSTMLSQLIDTMIFISITYFGNVNINVMLQLFLTMYLFKFIIAICDTPFMYIASRIKSKEYYE